MVRLHPIPEANHTCPYCQVRLEVKDWYIPGMRNLADLKCPQCKREFYGDLPAGQALYTPMLLDKATGIVHDNYGVAWFADWLRESYANRINSPVTFIIENLKPLKNPILLNCLDTLYGHCLLKLLNAQYYIDQHADLDLIVLVPRFLRWMVPDRVASIWTVDISLKQGTIWNDWLATQIKRQIQPFKKCWLSVAYSHPHPKFFDIERFTRVTPFPIEEWETRLERPTITFIWREDRLWYESAINSKNRHLKYIIQQFFQPLKIQRHLVLRLAEILKREWPSLDFAISGLGVQGGFPDWITDLRCTEISEATERMWCRRYASSHIVIGVHGSNMLLPSAHAGAVIDLMPLERWGNLLQDILFYYRDCREAMFRYRFVPISIRAYELAFIASSLLKHYFNMKILMQPEFCDHRQITETFKWLTAEKSRPPDQTCK